MHKGILGIKLGMTRLFNEKGEVVPVTAIKAGPCVVVQKKTKQKDGYDAIQVGFQPVKESKLNKPIKGHFNRAQVGPFKYLREFRVENIDDYEVGQEIKADAFNVSEKVDVVGTSKGKGFTGGVKRHGFNRGPMSHGSRYHRGPGSLGAMGPARVFKGRKLPGRSGGERVTVQNLEVVKVDTEQNLLLVKGAVPGPRKGLLAVKESVKGKEE